MGRELRRVPGDWQHPRDGRGRLLPLLGHAFASRCAEWEDGIALWMKGKRNGYVDGKSQVVEHDEPCTEEAFSDWDGERPDADDYMPDWPEAERTHFQWYENVSEGTPLSPPMPSAEALSEWLASNPGRSVPELTASEWARVIEQGFAMSMVMSPGIGIVDGATFAARATRPTDA